MQANDQNGQDKVRQNRHPPQTTIIGKSMLFFYAETEHSNQQML